jgi:hypothetical protein
MVSRWYRIVVSRSAPVKTLSLRIADDDLARRLEQESRRRRVSINGLIVEAIRGYFGLAVHGATGVHHDLDHLAGTWSEHDEQEFAEATRGFSTVDREMWE